MQSGSIIINPEEISTELSDFSFRCMYGFWIDTKKGFLINENFL